MTWVDFAVIGVLAASALLAFIRGFVREVLGVGAWVGAIAVGIWAFPFVRGRFEHWIPAQEIANPVAFGAVFLVTLIVLSVVSHWIGALVRASALGGLDRTLGLVFGLVRGAALVVFAYIAAGLVVTADNWPAPVREARLLPYVYDGASWTVAQLPAAYRPRLSAPPAAAPPSLGDLLNARPQGSALSPPAAKN